jgi:hypothetical protein
LKNPKTKNWAGEWLKVKALTSSPSTTKNTTKKNHLNSEKKWLKV